MAGVRPPFRRHPCVCLTGAGESGTACGRCAFGPDLTAMLLDLRLDDRQADPARFVTARQRLEYDEDPVMKLGWDARLVIGDAEFRHAGVKPRRNGNVTIGTIMVAAAH
jgi:hypothetical protein